MKTFDLFLDEESKEDTKATTSEEGKDDEKYYELMDEYKQMRIEDPEKASKIFDEAMELSKNGDVSNEAQMAAAY